MEKCKNCKKKIEQEGFCSCCQDLIAKLDFETFNNERKWLEELFIGRLNNFLVVFSLIVTAGFANSFTNWKYLVFYFGAILLLFCWFPIVRAYHKYDNAVRILLNQEKIGENPNPIKNLHDLYNSRKQNRLLKNIINSTILAYWIPSMCIIFLIIIGLCISFGCIK